MRRAPFAGEKYSSSFLLAFTGERVFILNYWITPHFIRESRNFGIAPSPLGRVVQVMLVRYHHSPVGPYDELLIMDHPLISRRRLSTIQRFMFLRMNLLFTVNTYGGYRRNTQNLNGRNKDRK